MQPVVQPALLPEPRVFRYSLDWRFLLPVEEPSRIHVVCEDEPDFAETLAQVGMQLSSRPFTPSSIEVQADQIHALVFPFGLPLRRVSAQPTEQTELFHSLRRQLCPGGYFLLGFRNSRLSHSGGRYHASTPRRMTSQLSRAGFGSIRIVGAMPDLRIPEYLFELNPQAMRFALQHRFRRKPVILSGLHIVARTVGLARISDFLPCYFAVATA